MEMLNNMAVRGIDGEGVRQLVQGFTCVVANGVDCGSPAKLGDAIVASEEGALEQTAVVQ
jgi:hypothetical protein